MLEAQDLKFSYGDHEVLKGVDFQVTEGRICGLFGPNGSGKTTLFRCCLGLLKGQGTIKVGGRRIDSMRQNKLARLVSYVPQSHQPPFPYSVFDVVLMGRTPHMGAGIFRVGKKDNAKAMEAIERLGISDLTEAVFTELSGGQRQLVLIARALAQETPLMLLDEPTSALDFSNQIKLWKLLTEVAASGITVVTCVHDPNHVSWFCDDVVMMHEGKVLAMGETREVFGRKNLNILYDDACEVVDMGAQRMVVPQIVSQELAG
ncbi:MAG: ABC transporter ATP-binding protein [Actinomycetaceae bacterium]|nr:ABC transporter ATP-binding protein [Actinomycetaceae bacterium]